MRRWAFRPFRVGATLLASVPGALVMHCLPAHRGKEIEGDVLDGPRSVVFDQAENRLYVQQAVLLRLIRRTGIPSGDRRAEVAAASRTPGPRVRG